ncbi:hypothetical protein HDU93_006605 [Gonapodya sp. JEL0774]|nr:hypothetical protein HDU93_006605 [Gonapodya sp. JEL0774]
MEIVPKNLVYSLEHCVFTPSSPSVANPVVQAGFRRQFHTSPATRALDAAKSTQLHEFSKYLLGVLPKYIQRVTVFKDELTLYIAPSAVVPVMTFLRDHTQSQYKQCMDVCGVDFPTRPNRFEVVYHLQSIRYNSRIRVKTYADEVSAVPSVTPIWVGANWYEREAYDMYGIFFSGHPDLRRILTDYGFEGHPLRKDFPLTGYVEVRYDEEKKRVVAEPLELSQQFRNFDYSSAWEMVGPGVPQKKIISEIEAAPEPPKPAEEKKEGQPKAA